MPLISIIIPCYNSAKFLSDTIKSCLLQTFQKFEIIIVDDGSTDNTREVVNQFIQSDTRIHYICQQNKGVAAARNNGWRAAKGMYIQFLDADDILLPTKLEKCLQLLKNQPHNVITYTNFEIRTQDLLQIYAHYVKQPIFNGQHPLKVITSRSLFPIHSPLVSKKMLDLVGGFNEELVGAEDWYLWICLAAHEAEFIFIDEVLVYIRAHGENRSRQKERQKRAIVQALKLLKLLPNPNNVVNQKALVADAYQGLGTFLWEDQRNADARQEFWNAFITYPQYKTIRRVAMILATYFFSPFQVRAVTAKFRPQLGSK